MTKNATKLYNYIHSAREVQSSRVNLAKDMKMEYWTFIDTVRELKALDLIEVVEYPLMYGDISPVWRAK